MTKIELIALKDITLLKAQRADELYNLICRMIASLEVLNLDEASESLDKVIEIKSLADIVCPE